MTLSQKTCLLIYMEAFEGKVDHKRHFHAYLRPFEGALFYSSIKTEPSKLYGKFKVKQEQSHIG